MEEAAIVQLSVGTTNSAAAAAYGDLQLLNPLDLGGHLLVQFWTNYVTKIEEGRIYYELTNNPIKYVIIGCDEDERSQLFRYRTHFAGCTFRSYRSGIPEGVIDRVFHNRSPEMSPDISFYSQDEYPHRDFALSCGIRSSFCFPFFKLDDLFTRGVMEIVSTHNQDVGTLRKFCESFKELDWFYSFGNIDIQKYVIPEIDHLLDVVCQTFQLPLTQYWIDENKDNYFTLIHQFSYRDFKNLAPWCQFKDACLHKSPNEGHGPLGASVEVPGAFFCRDITALSITHYPFAHYARNCGSVSCFTIYLCRQMAQPDEEPDEDSDEEPDIEPIEERVLEFFLPMDNYYPQTLLNSIWATMKECLPNWMLVSGEQLGQGVSVEVINSSPHNEPKSFKIGQPDSSLPHHEGSGYTHTLNLSKNGTEQRSNSNSSEEAASGETSKKIPNEVTEIICSENKLEEESNIRCIKPHSLASQPKIPVNILQHEGNTVEMDHSALEMTLEEPLKLKKHTVTAERVDNLVEVSPDEDIEYAVTTASKRLKPSKIPFTLENIHEHVGRPLKDAAESFGVSPSTFKRRCRSVGITWWQPSRRKLIDNETGEKNVSSSMRRLQDTPVISHKSQELEMMSVKATYNGVTIKFELTNLSGMSELEDNVIKRLHLERNSFSIKYQDNDNELILIGCDEDVQECMKFSRSAEKTTIKMLIHPPVNHYAP